MKGGVVIDVPGMVSGVAPTSATASTLSGCAHLRASGRQVNMAVARSRALGPRGGAWLPARRSSGSAARAFTRSSRLVANGTSGQSHWRGVTSMPAATGFSED